MKIFFFSNHRVILFLIRMRAVVHSLHFRVINSIQDF